MTMARTAIIDEQEIEEILTRAQRHDEARVREILTKARELHGLDMDEMAVLMQVSDPELLAELFDCARYVKNEIYGRRLVLFAPLYVSNLCANECLYCAFRKTNTGLKRRALTQDEVRREVEYLVTQGHKRVLLVAGESYPDEGFPYILKCIETIYKVKIVNGEIRRVNVNIAPLTLAEFRELKQAQIGTYQLFQETYHRPSYERVHVEGKKRDFDWRITAMDRAMEAGIDDLGVGILFGLYDWRWEIMALMQHVRHLENTHGVGPHTISVPRLEPAAGSDIAAQPPHPVPDTEFRKIVAILRMSVPYTGIIMSTRETPNIRRETFALGVSQISAGSRTNPGGYSAEGEDSGQFSLGDHRPLEEVIRDVAQLGYLPSFCTACYRLGRTGQDFMDLAKPGKIKDHCDVNAVSTFMEYLLDYAGPSTRAAGTTCITQVLQDMTEPREEITKQFMERVKRGERDVFV